MPITMNTFILSSSPRRRTRVRACPSVVERNTPGSGLRGNDGVLCSKRKYCCIPSRSSSSPRRRGLSVVERKTLGSRLRGIDGVICSKRKP
jgi:hypothetical protein